MNALAFSQPNSLVNVFHAIIDGTNQLAVDARELHKYLEVGRRFATWIKERIAKYQFVENQDFVMVSQIGEINGQGGDRRSIEYHLTLDMAKELSMVENNDKGREARRYFIKCEKILYQTDSKQRQTLVSACTKYCAGSHMNISDVYNMVGSHFGYEGGIVNLPAPVLPEAVAFVYELILAKEKGKSQRFDEVNERVIRTNTYALVNHMFYVYSWFKTVQEPLTMLNPKLTNQIKGHFSEGMSSAKSVNAGMQLGFDSINSLEPS